MFVFVYQCQINRYLRFVDGDQVEWTSLNIVKVKEQQLTRIHSISIFVSELHRLTVDHDHRIYVGCLSVDQSASSSRHKKCPYGRNGGLLLRAIGLASTYHNSSIAQR
jgi:hypothetical protein